MAMTRDEILADFQACTGIEDVNDAIECLEQSNWDLMVAVNQAMSRSSQQIPFDVGPDIEMIEEIIPVPHSSSSIPAARESTKSNTNTDVVENINPGTSKSTNSTTYGTLTFLIHYLDNVYDIKISELSSIRILKEFIWDRTKVIPCKQRLHGWATEPKSNCTSLVSLNLPKENTLYMSPVTEDNEVTNDSLADCMTKTYTLNIKDEIHNKMYNLKFLGTNTILEVKSGIYTLIDVPVRNQQWKGWPSTVKDDTVMLAQSGISYPEHNLSVSKASKKEEKKEVIDLVDSDNSADEAEDVEEFEDAPEIFNEDDDPFMHNGPGWSTKIERLLPENVTDEMSGTLHFAEQFEKRYGPVHPEFFAGTFEDAIKESCLKPAQERKLLGVYLHHDNSVLTNVFCTQVLGFETVLQLLSESFIVWGWDITYESNKERFLFSVEKTLGPIAANRLRNIDVDTLPVFVIITRSRSKTKISSLLHANVGVSELLTQLMQVVFVSQEEKVADIGAEQDRQAREQVREEQDRAYQESLAADRAKEEAKQMEKRLKEQAENERLAEKARKEAHRQAVESSLPPEPEEGAGDGVLKVRVRLPGGKFLERRFQSDTPLQTLLNFLIVEGYPTEDYKVLCSWPRRDLTSMDTKLTLTDLKFCPQETVILEER